MNWETIKKELGKKLGDPTLVKYGGVLKNYFRAAYVKYAQDSPTEQLYVLQADVSLSLSEMRGTYDIPKSMLFIDISAVSYSMSARGSSTRFTKVTPSKYALSISNPIMQPNSEELFWYRDNNKIMVLSNNKKAIFRFNYLPELSFDNIDSNLSDAAISGIMNLVVYTLLGKDKNEYTKTD